MQVTSSFYDCLLETVNPSIAMQIIKPARRVRGPS